MRARRLGTTSNFRLFQSERQIGTVDGTSAIFRGFETRDDAALAASAAHQALTKRRKKQPHRIPAPQGFVIMDQGSTPAVVAQAGVMATLLPPAPEHSEIEGWGFEIPLLPEERFEVFAVARARAIWRALRGTGIYRRMRQFRPEAPLSA